MRFFFITSSPEIAAYAVSHGVDRIFVDLEINGKVERQGHLSTVISRHSFEDVAAVRAAIPGAELMVRLNPLFTGSGEEVDRAIGLGADVLMLPMFHGVDEVRTFCGLVRGRVRTCLLVETLGAVRSLGDIVAVEGVDEVHIGLNDLHLELGSAFMFEPMADGLIDTMAQTIRSARLPFGIGGVARFGEGLLPAEVILAEHVRLGSSAAILSRTFHRNMTSPLAIESEMNFAEEIAKLRAQFEAYRNAPASVLDQIHRDLQKRVGAIVASKQQAQAAS